MPRRTRAHPRKGTTDAVTSGTDGNIRLGARAGSSVEGRAEASALLDELTAKVQTAALTVLWRQWNALGSMTSAPPASAQVDAEALLLLSLVLHPVEPRLGDVVLDWISVNSDLLSVGRLATLRKRYPESINSPLRQVAEVAVKERKDHRWQALLRTTPTTPSSLEGNVDLHRRLTRKPRATRVRTQQPAALPLRLRLAFGVGVKADLLAFLLGTEANAWVDTATIARATGYAVSSVRQAAEELTQAGLVEKMREGQVHYHVALAGWRELLHVQHFPPWRAWNEQFVLITAFLEWSRHVDRPGTTPFVLDRRGRELLAAHKPALQWQQVWHSSSNLFEGEPQIVSALTTLSKWMMHHA